MMVQDKFFIEEDGRQVEDENRFEEMNARGFDNEEE